MSWEEDVRKWSSNAMTAFERAEAKAIVRIKNAFLFYVKQEFEQSKDPYGNQWQERKHDYPWKILNKTGKLKNSFQGYVTKDSVTITTENEYYEYLKERWPMLPSIDKLPKNWEATAKSIILEELRRELAKA